MPKGNSSSNSNKNTDPAYAGNVQDFYASVNGERPMERWLNESTSESCWNPAGAVAAEGSPAGSAEPKKSFKKDGDKHTSHGKGHGHGLGHSKKKHNGASGGTQSH